jgi:hypothetical protein
MTLDVSQPREDLHDSESDADIDIDIDSDMDNEHTSQSSDKENVRPVLREVLLPCQNQNIDVDVDVGGVDVECHIDAWLDSASKVIPLLAAKAAERVSSVSTSHSAASTQQSQVLIHLAKTIQEAEGEFRDAWKGSSSSDPAENEHDRMQD